MDEWGDDGRGRVGAVSRMPTRMERLERRRESAMRHRRLGEFALVATCAAMLALGVWAC